MSRIFCPLKAQGTIHIPKSIKFYITHLVSSSEIHEKNSNLLVDVGYMLVTDTSAVDEEGYRYMIDLNILIQAKSDFSIQR